MIKKTGLRKLNISFLRKIISFCLLTVALSSCDSQSLLDLAFNPPGRKPINRSKVALNSFFVNSEFGTVSQQFDDITDNLKINDVRILMVWSDGVQASPGSSPEFGFYDSIVSKIPSNVRAHLVLVHTPSWITNSDNWSAGNGNPRFTFVEEFVRPVVRRYRNVPQIVGYEIWNEPDNTVVSSDSALGLTEPANYAELLAYASNVVKDEDPGALVIMAATKSIQQNFPNSLNYNKALKDLGVESFTDIWNVHYYGKQFESVVTNNGVADFLNGISKTIWVTESGEVGPNNQLAYVETAWPFLEEKIPGIQKFFYYQYGETTPAESNYGLRTIDPSFPVSDLYVFLRDN
ncbi:MAG: cellulase family glycosylhydrolase [Proteobacteria bacterium]|nr:cellulase family glycosylhydrolase [Pseudomonadota bacterium]